MLYFNLKIIFMKLSVKFKFKIILAASVNISGVNYYFSNETVSFQQEEKRILFFFQFQLNHTAATDFCKARNQSLLAIETPTEFQAIKQLLTLFSINLLNCNTMHLFVF